MDASFKREGNAEQTIGSYRIFGTIGKGSFGKVKKGVHIKTNETVAIKILDRKKLKNAKMDKKICREIKILKLFSHPNICRLYEVIYTSTEIFLILEYIDGGELFDHIVKHGVLKEDAARYIFQQIICALEYCHHFLVAHRDLKPENILLGPKLQVKLIDFGLSNIMKDGEFLTTSCGSPNYAAPEVISGKLYFGPEVDVWSCGVILYALLCGCLPFDEESIPGLFNKIKKGQYQIPPHISRGARELIQQILVVDPLLRLTIPQIRDNAWFNMYLPAHLFYNEANLRLEERILSQLVSRVVKELNMRDRDVREEIKRRSGPGFVTYSILFDADRRKKIMAEAPPSAMADDAFGNSARAGSVVSRATERELNSCLLLTQSPAMEVLLDKRDALHNKTEYNGGNFVPVSVKKLESHPSSMNTPVSGGVLSITRRQETTADGSTFFGSVPQRSNSHYFGSSTLEASAQSWSLGALASSNNERQRVGSVARSSMVFTQEQERLILSNNLGWRIGLMTDFGLKKIEDVIYRALKFLDLEWKKVAPYRLLVRTTSRTWTKINPRDKNAAPVSVMFDLYLFRMHEKHDDGYLVDFGVVKGSLVALDIILHLSTRLLCYINLEGGGYEADRWEEERREGKCFRQQGKGMSRH